MWVLCALVCLFSGAAAIEAEQVRAKSRSEVHQRSLRLAVKVEATNGYEGWIATEGHRRVTLTLRKGRTAIEARTSGRVSRHGIEAGFGDLGRISVRFRGRPLSLSSSNGKGKRRCRGRKSAIEAGLFSGTIRFRGENGFTQVSSKRARGYVERHYRRVCRRDPKDDSSFTAVFERLLGLVRLTTLRAVARVDRANILFEAAAIDFSPILGPGIGLEYAFSAQTVERGEGIRLTRSVSAEGGDGSFLFSRRKATPRTATVTPPRPFTGTAKYLEEPGLPRSWAGSLAARLPGAGLVGMASPDFRADICKLTFAAFLEGRCLPGSGQARLRSLSSLGRDLPQGNGSHSQPLADARLSWSR